MAELAIKDDACRGCELCADNCPTDVITYDSSTHKATVAEPEFCIDCLSCTYICPSGAITNSDYHVVKNFYRDLTFSKRMERYL